MEEELKNIETDINFNKAMEIGSVLYDCLKKYVDTDNNNDMNKMLMEVPLIAFDRLKQQTGWINS